MEQRGAERLGVEPHPGADLRHPDRVDDELLARLAALVGVVHAGVDERLLDPCAVDRDDRLVGVLLDDREQVAEQPLLDRGQLAAIDRLLGGLGDRLLDAVDLDPLRRDQGLGFAFSLRNRRPSSYRFE
jgi:hypothetical protein